MEITIPYQYTPRDYQLTALKNLKRFNVLVWARRTGKTKMMLNEMIRRAIKKKGTYYMVLPTYTQAKKVVWTDPKMIREHVPKEIIVKKNDSELMIELRNGSIFYLVGADNPDSLRGISCDGVIFDEYSEMKEETWTEIFQPILRESGGWATFIFTPKGRNHSWRLYESAKRYNDWYSSILNVSEAPESWCQEEIEAARREMPTSTFQQELMCEFLDDAMSVFRRVDQNIWEEEPKYERERFYKLGVDLAKYQDWTVVTTIDLHEFKVFPQDRFNNVDWSIQKARIEADAFRYNRARVSIDSTGVGDPITEDLRRAGVNIEPFVFTGVSRQQLLDHLVVMLEQDKIKIPPDENLLTELKAFRTVLTPSKKVKYEVPSGEHDDCVMSLALAVWGVDQPLPIPNYNDKRVFQKMTAYKAEDYG